MKLSSRSCFPASLRAGACCSNFSTRETMPVGPSKGISCASNRCTSRRGGEGESVNEELLANHTYTS